jgi:hypothetical protein
MVHFATQLYVWLLNICGGAIAGAVTGVVTTPLDVIKTRLMTQGSTKTYSGVFDCANKIWTQEGSAAFLKVGVITANMILVKRGEGK